MERNQNGSMYLKTLGLDPENQEAPIAFVESEKRMDGLFYRRNHFPYPEVDSDLLDIGGLTERNLRLTVAELKELPARTVTVVLKCAGNKRSLFSKKTFGEQWGKGALSLGTWTGVPLRSLLEKAGLKDGVQEIVFNGHDEGMQPGFDKTECYGRSLPLEKAIHPDTIVAYAYNGERIPECHGAPLRLIVPGWYAMASVKWLRTIQASADHFEGPFQTDDYVYYPHEDSDEDAEPVRQLRVNSTIQQPLDMAKAEKGEQIVKGIAWTGIGHIEKVEVSVDSGCTWEAAELEDGETEGVDYGWVPWSFKWHAEKAGIYKIFSRAKDSEGRVQPGEACWNRKGYGYNAIDRVKLKVLK
ncbi:sulfite oxidase [Aciduricibacillus chroicocephali]|uniref:Sulfite oxidase n=1 Tax=Aciduricibacillus chroicocephali TaxID=3054939 RepID=A0ABY9KUU5_9BACI|nr:sulfite oxidase [Bacillaceae bacterium 44XB]